MTKRIRVLVVDDSAVMREMLKGILQSDPGIEVVAIAQDAYDAREKIKALDPDVLTLDVEMPRMDGLTFLSNLMRLRPMPVVMCASITHRGADLILSALDLGAVDFVAKPAMDAANGIRDAAQEIIFKVKMAAHASVRARGGPPAPRQPPRDASASRAIKRFAADQRIIAIGASTGGTEAIKQVLSHLPADLPGVVVVQHIPKAFSQAFAERVNASSELQVCEAVDGQEIMPGHAYIAPGDQHLQIARYSGHYQCRLTGAAPVNRHCPSVDVLFQSVAELAGSDSLGVILTGMGRDGAAGLKAMRDAGAGTMAQDEATSVVWGMPGAAWQLDAVQSLHPLARIAEHIVSWAHAGLLQSDTGCD